MQPPNAPQKKLYGPSKGFLWALVIISSGVLVSLWWISPRIVCVLNARTRTEPQLKALSTAIECYKMDHGFYPRDPDSTDVLRTNASFDPDASISSSAYLYKALVGNPNASDPLDRTQYYPMDPSQFQTTPKGVTYIVDAWGNSIGYSTLKARHPVSPSGNNATFDLWSTGGEKRTEQSKWIKNW